MLTDPIEINIIADARQSQVRDPKRSRQHFVHIFEDFLSDQPFQGRHFLDLGPGQWDFGELSRERGGTTTGIDNDPPVVELGQHKGFQVVQENLKHLKRVSFADRFDGVFCKYSINAFWFWDNDEVHATYIREIVDRVKPDGWSWIAPWNGVPRKANLSEGTVEHVLALQARCFEQHGYCGIDLSKELSAHYGVHGNTANRALFVKNLSFPPQVSRCPFLTCVQ